MRITAAQLALIALLLPAACSSRNPDALVGANVELNQPAAEANAELNETNTETASAGPAPAPQAAANEVDPRVEEAVNGLKSVEADDNYASEAEDQFNRENDDRDDE
jgi:hypothetical protein